MSKPRIISAIFGSVWNGRIVIETPCMVNLDTKEVFNAEINQNCDGLDMLEREYIEINGVHSPALRPGFFMRPAGRPGCDGESHYRQGGIPQNDQSRYLPRCCQRAHHRNLDLRPTTETEPACLHLLRRT